MEFNPLLAISPIDGRYYAQTAPLNQYFSEFALIRYRLHVEVEYFIALCKLPLPQLKDVDSRWFPILRNLYKNFSITDAKVIKAQEKVTNHDVKSVEYFLKNKMKALGLDKYYEFVHFGLTSQDINNTAIPMSLKHGIQKEYIPLLRQIIDMLEERSREWAPVVMLAHTHGQPASPTRLGKEIQVFKVRLEEQLKSLEQIPFAGKFGGSTGNFNAHNLAYPQIDWHKFADKFLNSTLGIQRSFPTTQIEHYDYIAALCHNLSRINTICIDLSRDMWSYVSMNYFKQHIKDQEIGSSAMPHKINPIDFENAEGNFGVANAIFCHLAAKLPVSRLQRDLTDSTVLRNLGVPLAHTLLAFKSLQKGFEKVLLNMPAIEKDIDENWAIISEAIQTILRRENYPQPYETLKVLTRTNMHIDKEYLHAFIRNLDISQEVKDELLQITPKNYIGH
ncbi:MAG TPA: adenylosuccinate lyase [Bacteroidales bacterium]|jgi:adenylosuccinate lyase|nr:adenylosuccinate lyase [Bacteroidales bacterium]MCZ2418156.1 adenylosuccinate lyase [Burkholderiales bacterium]OQC57538.1 MAG: Adenylosuccinate lyase [Bacteroidetes bacterium ADurb.Bin013]MBP8999717.1 adenylosuccinate lyase [Bacteroidales bacterium]MBV6456118.1 Adenylosuccinate lyase [Bacteroidales bacterium]